MKKYEIPDDIVAILCENGVINETGVTAEFLQHLARL